MAYKIKIQKRGGEKRLMIKNRKNLKVKAGDFKMIKALIEAGVPKKTIQELTGRAYGTIHFIGKTKNLIDYRKTLRKAWEGRKHLYRPVKGLAVGRPANPAKEFVGSLLKATDLLEEAVVELKKIATILKKV